MADNLGTGVSYVVDSENYNYDTVVFQKGKPPLDTELNLSQDVQRLQSQLQLKSYPSGWLTLRTSYTSSLLSNKFYTQNPTNASPEYALINGTILHITGTGTTIPNTNLIDLGTAPTTGNRVNGVFLEMWRALLSPDSSVNRPDPTTIIDSIIDIDAVDSNHAWAVGENGLILQTSNGGSTWNIQLINTKNKLNSVSFINSTVGWVCGNVGTIGKTSSAGTRWTLITTGYTNNLNGIYATSQNTVWAVGDSGLILKTTNGVNWLSQNSGVTDNLKTIYFYDSLVGWACGDNGTIIKTTDGGTTWTKYSSGTINDLSSIIFYDLNYGFAVGELGTILKSSDGGLSWVNQSNNIYNGSTYSSLSVDYTDVTMIPNLDVYVNGEDVSSQFNGTNKNCTIMNVPITKGDGLGTTTNTPGDIIVKVNNITVAVDVLVGSTGQIVLNAAPVKCDTVKVYYYYKLNSAVFNGKAWITGKSGTILYSDSIGGKWFIQTSAKQNDLNAVSFVGNSKGWIAGNLSFIEHTDNSGTLWVEQITNIVSRLVQRAYYKGNVETEVYLTDDSIHPDTAIETTKRVQIQYRIKVISNVDPANYPEAGLGSDVVTSMGPNTSATSNAFENMGATEGDYGLWRAICPNTVDGYSWAIPMFFVARRNSSNYNAFNNANGSNNIAASIIRPDLLTSSVIVESDILDVRRKIIIPSAKELLDRNFEDLMNNTLKTRFVRDTVGGDKYGTEILHTDRIGGVTADGGTEITGAQIADAVAGDISSSVTVRVATHTVAKIDAPVPTAPTSYTFSAVSGIYHMNSAFYKAYYNSPNSIYHMKPIPGYWAGLGTDTVTFTFNSSVNTTTEDPNLADYRLEASWIDTSSKSLTYIPSEPFLVKNYSSTAGQQPFYYQGVFDTDINGRKIEEWDSGVSGYNHYALAYPYSGSTTRASSVELHYFVRLTTVTSNPVYIYSNNILKVNKSFVVKTGEVPYVIQTISKINNITSGFSYKISDLDITDTSKISVESVSGFPFIADTVIEIVAMVLSAVGTTNIRNGATVDFTPANKKIGRFCKSYIPTYKTVNSGESFITFTTTGDIIIGVPTTEMNSNLTQAFCWINDGVSINIYPVTVTGLGTSTVTLTFTGSHPSGNAYVQFTALQSSITYDDAGNNGLLINYNYIPYQSISELPTNLNVEILTKPECLYVSNLGTGGSLFDKTPYSYPLNNIPVNDISISNDDIFCNVDYLRFNGYSVNNGFVQLPIIIQGYLSSDITLSGVSYDGLNRYFYNTCSKEFIFEADNIKIGNPRKVFFGTIAKIKSFTDSRFMSGECVMILFSKNFLMDLENNAGSINNSISLYKLPYKFLMKI